MAKFEGVAVIYMNIPMTKQTLPLKGTCSVDEKKISLKFPLTGVSFDLPKEPSESEPKIDFKINFDKDVMQMVIEYNPDIKAYVGTGCVEERKLVSFLFYESDNPLKCLESL